MRERIDAALVFLVIAVLCAFPALVVAGAFAFLGKLIALML